MRMATMTSAMWLTEEYAMSDFRSVWRRQIELVMIMPHNDNIMIQGPSAYHIGRRFPEILHSA